MYEKFLEGDPIVSEGMAVGHMLHIRIVGKEGPNFTSLDSRIRSLCDEDLAYDVTVPLSDWADPRGKPYCFLCLKMSERLGLS